MKLFKFFFIILISSISKAFSAGIYARPGCSDTCGNVQIPYPFGIGEECSLNEWYVVDCNSSRPYLSSLNNIQVLSLSLEDQTVTVNMSMAITDCQNPIRNTTRILGLDLNGTPFLFARRDNKFMVDGCGRAFIMGEEHLLTGCSTTCQNTTRNMSRNNNCFGIGCCQISIPYYFKTYMVNTTELQGRGPDSVCGSAFLVDGSFSFDGRVSMVNNSILPIALMWTITREDISQISCPSLYRYPLDLGNGTMLENHACGCSSFEEGSAYLSDGCQPVEICAICEAEGRGYCGFNVTGQITCIPYPSSLGGRRSSTLGIILGVTISIGILVLSAIIFALYKLIQKTKDKKRREKFFKRNGGLLLQQQESTDESLVENFTLFSAKELEKATDNFNENRILGRGAQGTVYKGMLIDGRIVAIKRSKMVDESQLKQFINEVVVLSQVNHRNIVKLLGCCLETEVPLLVSEFISNGTLYHRLGDESDEFPLTLNTRLRIATEVAGALTYLHSATSIPIYHRDIKSTNILLDDKYRAKVSDFGTSRLVSIDRTHLTTLVKGTFGYLDPEYFQSSQFTEKSDVYSFGVVLVELLTSKRAILQDNEGEHISLATEFTLAMEEGHAMSLIDSRIIKEGSPSELMEIANLAMQCLNMQGKNRPTMKDVASQLESIRASHIPSMVHFKLNKSGHKGGEEEELFMFSYDASTSI